MTGAVVHWTRRVSSGCSPESGPYLTSKMTKIMDPILLILSVLGYSAVVFGTLESRISNQNLLLWALHDLKARSHVERTRFRYLIAGP